MGYALHTPKIFYKNAVAIKPVAVIITAYGKASFIISKYESLISGASDDVNKNKNAACPLGVATDGIFVPMLIDTAIL